MPFMIGAPETANGPVRYDSSGTKMLSAALAVTGANDAPTMTAKAVPSSRWYNRIAFLPFVSRAARPPLISRPSAQLRGPPRLDRGVGGDFGPLLWERAT